MLTHLETIHTPGSIEEAAKLVQQPGVYPLYGGVTLHRQAGVQVEAVVRMDGLKLDRFREVDDALVVGSMVTLERARQACAERADRPALRALAELLKADQPETLRNTMTIGDLLTERDPQSRTLTLLLALGAVLHRADVPMHVTVSAWLEAGDDMARALITDLRVPLGAARAAVAYEQVGRTPADAPIVGAVAYVEVGGDGRPTYTSLALCGVAAMPVRQPEAGRILDETGDVEQAAAGLQLDPPGDHWGSAEYRAEMARVLTRRVLARALEQANRL